VRNVNQCSRSSLKIKHIEIHFFFTDRTTAPRFLEPRCFLKQSTRCKLRELPLSARDTLLDEKREASRRKYKASRQRRRKASVVREDSHRRLLLHNFTVAKAEKTERHTHTHTLSLSLSLSLSLLHKRKPRLSDDETAVRGWREGGKGG